jgi:hypothetical protein
MKPIPDDTIELTFCPMGHILLSDNVKDVILTDLRYDIISALVDGSMDRVKTLIQWRTDETN